jgi:hypothetical protein
MRTPTVEPPKKKGRRSPTLRMIQRRALQNKGELETLPPAIMRILALTGPALLLPWSKGSKGEPRRWKHLQLELMSDRVHRHRLATADNIGVVLGKVSDGLISIDIDRDELVGEFLGLNPSLTDTLRTRGARGCNFWLRMNGDYPKTHKLKDKAGTEIGEFRSDGSQTIIFGTHPSGVSYSFQVEKPAMTIRFDDLTFFTRNGDSSRSAVTPLHRLI